MATAEYAAGVFHKELEQAELGRAKRDDLTSPGDLVSGGIKRQVANGDRFSRQGRTDAPHDCADAGDQFARAKGLGEVIVRSGFKAADLVILGAAGGQHDDWHMGGGLVAAQTTANLDPAGAFDHPIQHDKVWCFFLGEEQGIVAIRGDGYGIAFSGEAKLQQFGQRRIIFNQQKARLAHTRNAPPLVPPKPSP